MKNNYAKGMTAFHQQQLRLLEKVRNKNPELIQQLKGQELSWFKLTNAAGDDDETATLYIYDEIMPEWMAEWLGGVSAEGLIAQLNEVTAKTINVRINSPGGSLFEGITIYNTLISHSAKVNVFVDALAASAASVIAMAGDKITMMTGSQMMIHDALGIEYGNAADLREFADFLDRQSDNIAAIYAEKTGGAAKDFRNLMLAETWLFPEEAVALGLADEVFSRAQVEEEESEETEEEETEETEPEEIDPEEEETEPEEEEPTALMRRKHSLNARGFKHPGRDKAPAPPLENTDVDVDKFVAAFANFFDGGK